MPTLSSLVAVPLDTTKLALWWLLVFNVWPNESKSKKRFDVLMYWSKYWYIWLESTLGRTSPRGFFIIFYIEFVCSKLCTSTAALLVMNIVVVVRSLFKWHVAWYTNRYKSWYITIHITLAYLPPSLTGLISHYRVPHTWWQDTTGRDNCWIQCWQC